MVELYGRKTRIEEINNLRRRYVEPVEGGAQNGGLANADIARDDDETLAGDDAIVNRAYCVLVRLGQ
jgi:hypothetical protein